VWADGGSRSYYGLLGYKYTGNLGDEIQSIAARQFLPSVDRIVYRDALDARPWFRRGRLKLIMNGWFTHRPDRWPPAPHIDPFITSFHITNEVQRPNRSRIPAARVLIEGRNLEYLVAHAPIGARDHWTMDLLERSGVDCYFSGCLSLTLQRPIDLVRGDYLCINDLDDEIASFVTARTKSRIIRTTHDDKRTSGFRRRMQKADDLLRLYAGAKCVITSRLHCALPCLAIETPVLLINKATDVYRFSGLQDLVRHCSRDAFMSGRVDFDIDRPTPNSGKHLVHRRRLTAACHNFTGPAAADREWLPAVSRAGDSGLGAVRSISRSG
jgi:hypothetical protein